MSADLFRLCLHSICSFSRHNPLHILLMMKYEQNFKFNFRINTRFNLQINKIRSCIQSRITINRRLVSQCFQATTVSALVLLSSFQTVYLYHIKMILQTYFKKLLTHSDICKTSPIYNTLDGRGICLQA